MLAYDPPELMGVVNHLGTAKVVPGFVVGGFTDRHYRIVETVKQEITDGIAEGWIPPDIADFDELHDCCDANTLGGMCDDAPEGNADVPHLVWYAIQDVVTEWLALRWASCI